MGGKSESLTGTERPYMMETLRPFWFSEGRHRLIFSREPRRFFFWEHV